MESYNPYTRTWSCQGCHDSKCSCEPEILAPIGNHARELPRHKKPFLAIETVGGMTIAKKAHPQVVVVIPLTKNNATIILAEQYREAVKANVIGLPAGHIGDDPGHEKENALEAAKRELLEETGYEGDLYYLSSAASSPGMTDEITHFVLALNVVKKAEGGGGEENITVREVFFGFLKDYLESKPNCIVSAQMLAGLWAARSFLK